MAVADRVGGRRIRHRTSTVPGLIVGLVALSCRGGEPGPRIGYPRPWLEPALAQVAQQAIDAWGAPRAVSLPDSLMAAASLPSGYAGDIAFAEAASALPGVVAAVGPQSSRATLLVAPIYAERRIPLIAATATSDAVGALGPWVFQLAPDNAAEGAFMAGFALDRLRARHITIFYLVSDEYGLSLSEGVVRALRLRGVTPSDEVGIVEETDLPRRVTESVRRARPDLVVVAARGPEALAIARALYRLVPGARVIVGDGAPLGQAFGAAVGPAAAAMYGVAWWHPDLPDSASRVFAARYARVAGVPPTAAEAMYYDAIMVAAQAVRDVGPRPAAIRRYLAELGTARPAFHGVTGPISFAPGRRANLLMTRIANGAVVMVTGGSRP